MEGSKKYKMKGQFFKPDLWAGRYRFLAQNKNSPTGGKNEKHRKGRK